MAGHAVSSEYSQRLPDPEGIKDLLWGRDIKHDVFRRWTQGLAFSEDEPSAIVQHEGGPCAVLAPLQAFLLKQALFTHTVKNDWRSITAEERRSVLCQALAEMLSLVSSDDTVCLVEHVPERPPRSQPPAPGSTSHSCQQSHDRSGPETGAHDAVPVPPTTASQLNDAENATVPDERCGKTSICSEDEMSSKKKKLSHEEFHSGLRYRSCHRGDLIQQLQLFVPCLEKEYGVLLILYSVIVTKGLEDIKQEVEDIRECLIDGTFGHGSQSLINLLITGRAVNNVWDDDKVLSGLKLQGIAKQATIGFLTRLEHLRYCEVGWYLKNPKYPVWLLGSETHLTVLFSQERSIVSVESQDSDARRTFSRFDVEGCGFVTSEKVSDLLDALGLISEPNKRDKVKVLLEKLDPEGLGIVTLTAFLDEFFPSHQQQPEVLRQFTVMHYNGLRRSCPNNKLKYAKGSAKLEEYPEVQIITDSSAIKTCLMTKWPTVVLRWDNDVIPSLN